MLRRAFIISGLVLAACNSQGEDSESVGSASIAISSVPSNVVCIQVTSADSVRSTTQSFNVTPGQSTVLQLSNLPTGSDTFTGAAFSTSCSLVTSSSIPNWVGAPVVASINSASATPVTIVLTPNGQSQLTVDFEGDGDGGVADGGSTTDAGGITYTGSGTITANTGNLNVTRNGVSYLVENDVSSSGAANCQTLNVNGTSFTVTAQNCGPSTSVPVSSPGIVYGIKDPSDRSTGSPLPLQVSSIVGAVTSWSFVPVTAGTYDASYQLWFNAAAGDSTAGGTLPTSAYLAVWPYSQGSLQPAGSQIGTVTIAGQIWTVWTGTGPDGKPSITYVAITKTTSVNLDLKLFMTDAATRGVIQTSSYLSDIQSEFDILSGGVGLATSDYSVTVH